MKPKWKLLVTLVSLSLLGSKHSKAGELPTEAKAVKEVPADCLESTAIEMEVHRGDYILMTYVVSDRPIEIGNTPELFASLRHLGSEAKFSAERVFSRFDYSFKVQNGAVIEPSLENSVRTIGPMDEGFMWSASGLLQLMSGRVWNTIRANEAKIGEPEVTRPYLTQTTYLSDPATADPSNEIVTSVLTIDGVGSVLTLILRRSQNLEALKKVAVMDQRQVGINRPDTWDPLPLKIK
jgi:hypothetical protein